MGSYVNAQLASINVTTEAILKDVSIGGFSLVIRSEEIDGIVGWVGQQIKAVFYQDENENERILILQKSSVMSLEEKIMNK